MLLHPQLGGGGGGNDDGSAKPLLLPLWKKELPNFLTVVRLILIPALVSVVFDSKVSGGGGVQPPSPLAFR